MSSQTIDAHMRLQEKLDRTTHQWGKALRASHDELLTACEELFAERAAIVAGKRNRKGDDGLAVPGFWLGALLAASGTRLAVQDTDRDALLYLLDVRVFPLAPSGQHAEAEGVRLEMRFAENPFFKHAVLRRDIRGAVEEAALADLLAGGGAGEGSEGAAELGARSGIEWREGVDLVADAEEAYRASGGPAEPADSGAPAEDRLLWRALEDARHESLFALFARDRGRGARALARLDHDLAIVSGIAAFRLFRGSELWPGDADGETTEALVLLQRNQERINSQLGTFEATTVALEARALGEMAALGDQRAMVLLRGCSSPEALAEKLDVSEEEAEAGALSSHLAPPGFWREAMLSQDMVREVVRRRDRPVLDYLYDITLTCSPPPGEQKAGAADGDEAEGEAAVSRILPHRRRIRMDWHFLPNPFFTNDTLSLVAAVESGPGSPLLAPPVAGGMSRLAAPLWQSGIDWRDGAQTNTTPHGRVHRMRGSVFWLFEAGDRGVAKALRASQGGWDLQETLGDFVAAMAGDLVPGAYGLYARRKMEESSSEGEDEETDSEPEGPPVTTRQVVSMAVDKLMHSSRGFFTLILVALGLLAAFFGRAALRSAVATVGDTLGVLWARVWWHLRGGAYGVALLLHVATQGLVPVPQAVEDQPPAWT